MPRWPKAKGDWLNMDEWLPLKEDPRIEINPVQQMVRMPLEVFSSKDKKHYAHEHDAGVLDRAFLKAVSSDGIERTEGNHDVPSRMDVGEPEG